MIEIIFKEDRFLAKGTFSMGIAGVFENKDFGDGNIEIDAGLQEILKELQIILCIELFKEVVKCS